MKRKRSTIREVAKRAKVAPITVSRVVNNSGYVSEPTRRRVEAAIEELNYIPNTISQSLRYKKTNMITLLVTDITNPFWTAVTRGVEDFCNTHGFQVVLCNTDEKFNKLEGYINLMLEKQSDGFVLAPTNSSKELVQSILSKHVPIVLVDRFLEGVDASLVLNDNENGAYQLVKHLIELGHKRIGALAASLEISTNSQRLAGYRRAMNEANLPIDENLITFGDFTVESGYEMAKKILQNEELPTALFATNNFIATGTIMALEEENLKVPDDMSIVCFGEIPYVLPEATKVTTANQFPYQVGVKAAEVLLEQINDENAKPKQVIIPVEISFRGSSRPPSAK